MTPYIYLSSFSRNKIDTHQEAYSLNREPAAFTSKFWGKHSQRKTRLVDSVMDQHLDALTQREIVNGNCYHVQMPTIFPTILNTNFVQDLRF